MQKFIIIIIFCFISVTGFSQAWKIYRYNAIIGIGAANYFGDIGGYKTEVKGIKNFKISESRPMIYLGARYKILSGLAAKINLNFAMLTASDIGSYHIGENYASHNLSFTTYLFEPSAQLEIYLLPDDRGRSSGGGAKRKGNNFGQISIYAFGGVGGAFFKPSVTNIDNKVFSLYQINDSMNSALVFPLGLGFKTAATSMVTIGFEIGLRLTKNDYVDGLFDKVFYTNDKYMFAILTASYKLKTSRKGLPEIFDK